MLDLPNAHANTWFLVSSSITLSAIEDISLSRLEQLKDVLTPNQFLRYQQKREQRMGIPSMSNNQGNLPPGINTSGGRGDE